MRPARPSRGAVHTASPTPNVRMSRLLVGDLSRVLCTRPPRTSGPLNRSTHSLVHAPSNAPRRAVAARQPPPPSPYPIVRLSSAGVGARAGAGKRKSRGWPWDGDRNHHGNRREAIAGVGKNGHGAGPGTATAPRVRRRGGGSGKNTKKMTRNSQGSTGNVARRGRGLAGVANFSFD